MSDLKSHGFSKNTSGAMKATVPALLMIFPPGYSCTARPKSPILTRGLSELSQRNIFRSLRSRCIKPNSCMSLRPSATYAKIFLASSSVNHVREPVEKLCFSRNEQAWNKSPPAANFVTIYTSPIKSNFSIRLMM